MTASVPAGVQVRTVLVLSIAQIFSGVGVGAIVATGSLLAVEVSGSDAWAGAPTTTMTLGAALASAILARIVPRTGRRGALAVGIAVAFVGSLTVLLGAVTVLLPVLLLGAALVGFATSVGLQARFAATDLSSPERRGRDLSLVVWMTTVGSVTGPNLIGVGEQLGSRVGIPGLAGLFVISAAGLVVALLVILIGLRPDPHRLARQLAASPASATSSAPSSTSPAVLAGSESLEGAGGPARVVDAAPDTPVEAVGVWAGWSALWASLSGRTALLGILTAHAVMVGVMAMTPVHMHGHGAAITLVGLTVSLHVAGMYVLAPVMGILADRLGPRAVLAGGMAVLLASTVFTAVSGSTHLLTTIGLVLLGLGWSAATVAGSSLVVGAVPDHQRVAAQGASDTAMSLAGGGGGILAGLVLSWIGFTGLSIVAGAGAAIALVLIVGRRG